MENIKSILQGICAGDRYDERLKVLPEVILQANINHGRYDITKKRAGNLYARFVNEMLSRYKSNDFVFLDRDSRPISLAAEHFKEARGLEFNSAIIALTREMLPQEMCMKIADVKEEHELMGTEHAFNEIAYLVKDTAKEDSKLNRFLRKNAHGLENIVVIDTGYWGTCAMYAANVLGGQYFMIFGPPGANSMHHDESEEHMTNKIEMIQHAFEIKGLFGTRLKTYKNRFLDIHIADYVAVEVAALEFLGKANDDEIRKVIGRYI